MAPEITDWQGCYDEGWKGVIVDESFAHPAKISYSLAARIYEHAFKAGWLKPGDTVVDPFGGICGTAIHAACHGVQWIGCELEPKFHNLGNQNIDLWQRLYGNYPEWVRPTLYCGDSRRLREVIGAADVCVSSPPFTQGYASGGGINKSGYGADGADKVGSRTYQGTGGERVDGNLESLPLGEIDAVLSSPPYSGNEKSDYRVKDEAGLDRDERRGFRQGQGCYRGSETYGTTDGQLGAMVVGSPPYENQEPSHAQGSKFEDEHRRLHPTKLAKDRPSIFQHEYGDTDGNIGNQQGETFWQAARDIVIQCHAILRPGGRAIWVVKDFVRKKQRVPFSDQWLALCESVGFQFVCRHRASLVKTGGTQKLLDGGEETRTTSRKSFFRRLAERRGSPAIDYEDVICVRRA